MKALCGLALALGLIAAGCGGDDCRSGSECGDDEACFGPNGGPVCGIAPRQECADDSECAGQICQVVADSCSFDGIGSLCRAACSPGECNDDFRCNANGACEAIPCDEGFDCPEHQACDPGSITAGTPVYDQHHGCVNVTCTADSGCPDTQFCVNGFCQVSIGRCEIPMAVP